MLPTTLARRSRYVVATLSLVLVAGVATSPPAFAFTPAAHTQLPDLQKNNYHGKPLRVVTFVKDDGHPHDPTTFDSRMIWFGRALVNSNWYKAASAAYQLGTHGTSASKRVTNMPTADSTMTATTLTAKVRSWVHQMGLHKNTSVRSIYVIYLPCVPGSTWSISICGSNSFHPQLVFTSPDPDFTLGDSMAVINLPTNQTPTVDGKTLPASHEIMEAATNSDNPGWRMHSNTPTNPFDVSPWVFNESGKRSNTEVMDMAGGSRITEAFVDPNHGYSYRYERVFTNASANANHDPFVPKSPLGYASVTNSTNGWIPASSATSTHHVTLRAWSTKAVPDWTISASVVAWKGFASTPATTNRCAVSLSRTTVNNGMTSTLTITYSGSHTASYWCAVKITSTTAGASASGTVNDKFRQWLLGIRFTP